MQIVSDSRDLQTTVRYRIESNHYAVAINARYQSKVNHVVSPKFLEIWEPATTSIIGYV